MSDMGLSTISEENESDLSSSSCDTISLLQNKLAESEDILYEPMGFGNLASDMKMFSEISSENSNISSCLRCFREIFMASSTMINRSASSHFLDLEDPGIDYAFNASEPPMLPLEGCEMYRKHCKDLDICPISKVCKSLATEELNLKYYVPFEKQMKALCLTLSHNHAIKELNLEDNWLSKESCGYLANVLEVNTMLKVLKMRECRIGAKGMQVLSKALGQSCVEELDLSFNAIQDEGLKEGRSGLAQNIHLRKLNLSYNNFTEESGLYLQEIVSECTNLEVLDLSWNIFNTFYALDTLSQGLLKNKRIQWLSIAWNGISSMDAMEPLMFLLRKHRSLIFLDLSNNLLEGYAIRLLMEGITRSYSLQHVKIGNNLFSPGDAYEFAEFLAEPRKKALRLLDMENMVVQRRFLNLLPRIRAQGREVIYGNVLSDYELYGPYVPKVLFERCRYLGTKPKKKRKRVNFGHFVLALPKSLISPNKFKNILEKKKLTKLLDENLVDMLMEQYENESIKKIDCQQLVKDYMMLYPDTQPEPPKMKKTKKGVKVEKMQEDDEIITELNEEVEGTFDRKLMVETLNDENVQMDSSTTEDTDEKTQKSNESNKKRKKLNRNKKKAEDKGKIPPGNSKSPKMKNNNSELKDRKKKKEEVETQMEEDDGKIQKEKTNIKDQSLVSEEHKKSVLWSDTKADDNINSLNASKVFINEE